jgi:hypothetical protein
MDKNDLKQRIAAAFGNRRTVTMNTRGPIGSANFYGDEDRPRFNRTQLFAAITCALENWNVPEEKTREDWERETVSEILADVL